MKPDKQQWEQVLKTLDSLFGDVYLRCDGYLVEASLGRVTGNRLKISVFVDGYIRGEWMGIFGSIDEMGDEARRFWFHATRRRMTPKELKSWEKIIGKRRCRERGYYGKYIYPTPFWNSARSFVRHLIKHNESIEILDRVTYREALEQRKAEQPDPSKTEVTHAHV